MSVSIFYVLFIHYDVLNDLKLNGSLLKSLTPRYPQIVAHIEDLVNKTGKKVIIKGTSGGTIASYGFLKSQSKKWVQDHVMAYIPVVPVFGGTVSSLLSVLYGWPRGAMKQCVSRQAAMLVPSVLWMWPRAGEDAYSWNKTEILVETPSKNYTAYELEAMLDEMGLQSVKPMYQREKADLLDKFEPPYVDTFVSACVNSATISRICLFPTLILWHWHILYNFESRTYSTRIEKVD